MADREREERSNASASSGSSSPSGASEEDVLPQHDARLRRPIPGPGGRGPGKRSDEERR